MTAELVATIAVIVVAMGFNYTNGFHDAANAIATSVSTRALTPRVALLMAAIGNLIGSFLGGQVAATVGKGVIKPPSGVSGLGLVFAGLVGAIVWNLVTWYFGIPSSSSHALIGGLVGSATAHAGVRSIRSDGLIRVVLSLVVSPLAGFGIGFKDSWEQALREIETSGGRPYAIPAGASDHPLGGLGFASWAYELAE